jgi:cell division protein FtsQ
MRRPSPLPSPESSRPAAQAPDTGEAAVVVDRLDPSIDRERDRESAVTPVGSDASGSEADPVGSASPTALLTAARPVPLPAPQAPPHAASAGPDDAPLRLRDVWRAARARRKALRAEVRRFTVRQRRRRAAWIGALSAVVLLVLATLGAAYSPLFAVEQIRVVGTSQLDPVAVQDALGGQLGTPLPLVDESAVKAALIGFPLVETYTLEARPPHELVVRVVERTPIGVVATRAGYSVVDAAGVALSTTAAMPAGMPLLTITGGTDSAAFASAGMVMRALPESVRTQVTAVSASSPDDVTLTLGGTNTQVVWGSSDDSALKAVALETTMRARPPASVTAYDVSSPRAVVVR